MDDTRKYKEIPNRDDHYCFGCSPINASGLQMKFLTDEQCIFSRLSVPRHLCGWSNLVHGGVLSTILDETMSWAAIYLFKKFTVTKSMQVDFLKPVYVETPLSAVARVFEANEKRRVVMEGFIYDANESLCVKSKGIFVLFSPDSAKKMNIIDPKTIENFKSLINV